jgi:hypothetical protein
MVSALPLARITSHRAEPAPMQTGSSKIAMIVLHHFGTTELFGSGMRLASQFKLPTC